MTEPPKQLGPYTIDREIGRGGMGVVYLGHDTRLDRPVAIKSLPEHLAQDAERLARFEREAKTLASLNHPNVAGIHGIESADGARYLILEFVEGQDLAELLDRGPMPPDEAVMIARQIAAGVEAAHEAGVIHRDLKPANIKITPEGQVKVLDFGLARAEEAQSSTGMSEAATITSPAMHSPTMPGVILGTAAYMSPEQARGRRVDRRTDIWSFGVVLYEMLTGIGPFRGETVTDSIGAILHKDIDLNKLPPRVPSNVRHVIQRCLVRDKTQRLQSIGDARIDLEHAGEAQEAAVATAAASPLRWALVALLVLLAGAAGVIIQRAMTPEPVSEGPMHVSIPIGTNPRIDSTGAFDLSPISRSVAYIATDPDDPAGADSTWVYIRDLDTREPRRLAGTEHARELSYSPDGTQIAFVWFDPASNREELRRINVNGGPALTVYTDHQGDLYSMGEAPVWISDEEIIALSQTTATWYTVPVTGGTPSEIATLPNDGGWIYSWPSGMLDSRSIIINRGMLTTQSFEPSLFILDVMTGESTLLLENARDGVLLPDGRLFFVRDNNLCLTRYDRSTRTITGGITPILSGLVFGSGFSLSPKGDLCTVRGDADESLDRLMSINRSGDSEPLIEARRLFFGTLSVSTDGRTVSLSIQRHSGGPPEAHTVDIDTGFIRPVYATTDVTISQAWAPDGRLAFIHWMNPAHSELMLIDPSVPSSAETPLIEADANGYQTAPTFTPDGRYMVFEYGARSRDSEGGIYAVDLQAPDAERTAFRVIVTAAEESQPAISPDGRWLAYTTDASGKPQVLLRPLDLENPEQRVREYPVSFEGGKHPFWSPDGTELFFLELETAHVMGVQVANEPELRISSPQKIIDAALIDRPNDWRDRSIDIMPDGERFVYIQDAASSELPTSLDLTLNWLEELDAISK